MSNIFTLIEEVIADTPELGFVLGYTIKNKIATINREYGVQKLTHALDPQNTKVDLVERFPRKVIDLRQIKYLIKRREYNASKHTASS